MCVLLWHGPKKEERRKKEKARKQASRRVDNDGRRGVYIIIHSTHDKGRALES